MKGAEQVLTAAQPFGAAQQWLMGIFFRGT